MKLKKNYLLITLLILELIFATLSYKSFNNKDKLSHVGVVNKKRFALYKKVDGNYVEVNTFPGKGYKINEDSYCLDSNHDEVEGLLGYGDGKVTVTSNKTVYCTLYFEKLIAIEIEYTNSDYTRCGTVQCALDELANILS